MGKVRDDNFKFNNGIFRAIFKLNLGKGKDK